MLTFLRNVATRQITSCTFITQRAYSQKVLKKYPKRIFSGIQPTGKVHLGNYLGALRKWLDLENTEEHTIWSIVDSHAITLPHDPKVLKTNILDMVATLLACGINPRKSILFQQSSVSMHSELCWVLGCITTMARLARLPQYKEKSESLTNIPLGLYIYPVLQSADILLYRSTHVPVGEDQAQHIQLTQELAESFNKKFGETFPIPHAIINDSSQRIKSLRYPLKKMSKSSNDPKGCINITEEPDVIARKVKKAVTDCTSAVTYEPAERPGVSNLITIHSELTGKSYDEICKEAEALDTGKYKLLLAEVVIEKLNPIREEYLRLVKEPAYLQEILEDGGQKAAEIAAECWYDVKRKVGFVNKKTYGMRKYQQVV